MTDEELKRLFAFHHGAAPADRRGCPDPERLRALAEREGAEADRLATLDHVMTCASCRRDYDLLAATASLRPRSSTRWPLALAATVLLAVSVTVLWTVRAADRERGAVTRIRVYAPVGLIDRAEPVRLVWAPVIDAFTYHAEVLAPDGALRFAGMTRDTLLVLPDSIGREGQGKLFWWVRASLRDGGEVQSELTGFRWPP